MLSGDGRHHINDGIVMGNAATSIVVKNILIELIGQF